ncbi:uncharacterized protein E0L32_006516 [Thyridium curvatum]|uniref:Uncharacterized protein n=1 Tax=Thyridium curvatum TaxID=1093900 RepID=A0A507B927_9PEZI|nr:uncharacterized protein E0L32_006516 [Thyridium curvatum]TPX13090.1 hypothetical protein E0L32_006516 [Thyridium curvatum]
MTNPVSPPLREAKAEQHPDRSDDSRSSVKTVAHAIEPIGFREWDSPSEVEVEGKNMTMISKAEWNPRDSAGHSPRTAANDGGAKLSVSTCVPSSDLKVQKTGSAAVVDVHERASRTGTRDTLAGA